MLTQPTFFEYKARAQLVILIRAHATPDNKRAGYWQAAAWLLERRYPNEYGRRERIDVNEEKPKTGLDEMLASLKTMRKNKEKDNALGNVST